MARHSQDKGSTAQVQRVPELVDLLKRLAAHRLALWERTYGRAELADTLGRTVADFRGALVADDWDGASSLLCRLVQEAGVKCSAEAREAMLTRLKGIMEARLATLASGDKTFNPPFAELGPEASKAFDLWNQRDSEAVFQATREARAAYWEHPLVWLCERLEERLGIDRNELEIAAGRLNTTLGLRGMEPLPAPDGTVADEGQPDWLWMLPKFKELDRDGTTASLWGKLRNDCAVVLIEVGLMPVSADSIRAGDDEEAGGGTEPRSDEEDATLDKLNSEIPPFDEGSENWISNKTAARLLGVETETLANHRSRGPKREIAGESSGLHNGWCFWRKRGKAHPFYYLPLMKQHTGHLVRTFPRNILAGGRNRH